MFQYVKLAMNIQEIKKGDFVKYNAYTFPVYSKNFRSNEYYGIIIDVIGDQVYNVYSINKDYVSIVYKEDIICIVS